MRRQASDEQLAAGELRQVWLTVLRRPWRTLVVAPSDASASSRAVAEALVEAARVQELGRFHVIDAAGCGSAEAVRIVQALGEAAATGARTVAAIDPPFENPGVIPLVAAADAAIVVFRYGVSDLRTIRLTVDMIGRELVLGCVAFRGAGERAAPAPAEAGRVLLAT